MEINLTGASAVQTKSAGLSPYVSNILGADYGASGWLSPNAAMLLWELSDTIYNCVDLIAMPFSQMTYALKDKRTGEYLSKTTDHPLLDLLEKPGFMQSSSEMMYSLMVSFLITSSAFPVLTGNVNYDPVSIKSIYANKANLVPDKNNQLLAFSFSDGENTEIYKRQLLPKRGIAVYQTDSKLSESIRILKAKRRNGVQSSSPLSRIIHQVYTKVYGNQHNSNLLKNGSRPSGLWSPGDGPMSQDQYEAFKSEVECKFSGPENAGRNVIAPRPVNYTNFILNPRDMDFVNLIEASAEDIYNLYHIPLAMVSAKTMTMSNFENAQTALFDQAVLPNSYMLLKQLGDFCLPRYKDGDRYELTFDEKTLPALRARMLDTAKTMREVGAYTDDEIRTTTGHESIEGGDIVYKPANLIASGQELDDYENDDDNENE